ncbi:hypothetical protein B0T10DRAFT_463046 [Thelonectria olida]|uniref:Uncharacterized protein n=1 Tax=Thelonectria olida TaxID=1576542 RepID=A0A9P8VYB0_9HYPO|nr:hypothetical protein B0T10DRAFT_463046 [Thelonectria olida]
MAVLASETFLSSRLCPEARTLGFSHEETFNWRKGPRINLQHVLSLSTWNATQVFADHKVGDPRSFDYYEAPSRQAALSVDRVVNLQQAISRKNFGQEICTQSWNCSYVVEFVAPGYKCAELANGIGFQIRKFDGSLPPFDLSSIVP